MMTSPGLIIAEFDDPNQDLSRSLSSFDIPHRETSSLAAPIEPQDGGSRLSCALVNVPRSMSSLAKSHSIPIDSSRLSSMNSIRRAHAHCSCASQVFAREHYR